MNANELRIGNMVYKSLKSGQGRTVINPIGCQDIVRIFEDIGSFNYAPIPLTEDILLKCGFVKIDSYLEHPMLHLRWITKRFTGADIDKPFLRFDSSLKRGSTDIHHLHQLQNLFFCLCGKELTIKL